jgi:GDP-mannose pyrophosphatase NudK
MKRNEILSMTTLLEGWSKVVRIVYRQYRRDGTAQVQDRDLLDRGDGITVLLYNRQKGTVLLLKQPRIIATVKDHHNGETIEACNGQVERETPEACACREVEQETGHKVAHIVPVAQVYASPGASLEIVHLFFAEYSESTKQNEGGGLIHEGEDIELLEIPFLEALRWIDEGVILDARTILVLSFAHRQEIFK